MAATSGRRPAWLAPRSLELPPGEIPVVELRSVPRQPFAFRKMVGHIAASITPGDLVRVLSPQRELLGYALCNPRAEMPLRFVRRGSEPPTPAYWESLVDRAIELRRTMLGLDQQTNACRILHAEADGFPGLVVDRYDDVLSAEVFSLAMYQRAGAVLDLLAARLGTRHSVIQVAPQTHGQEAFEADAIVSEQCPSQVVVEEFGTQFKVNFSEGHKTGFFCDQRENRRRLAEFSKGRSVADICCYTGGFAIQALRLGQAESVVGVDLDETAVAQARANAKLNSVKPTFVQADAFAWMRDMLRNGRKFGVVVLDPPKLIRSRRELEDGQIKYLDLNRLAVQLVEPGGLLLTCSCSGLMPNDEFLTTVQNAAWQASSRPETGAATEPISLQILARTGAAADHPVGVDCPTTEYLHAIWLRVLRT